MRIRTRGIRAAGELRRLSAFELELLANCGLLQSDICEYRHQARLGARHVLAVMRLLQRMGYLLGLTRVQPKIIGPGANADSLQADKAGASEDVAKLAARYRIPYRVESSL